MANLLIPLGLAYISTWTVFAIVSYVKFGRDEEQPTNIIKGVLLRAGLGLMPFAVVATVSIVGELFFCKRGDWVCGISAPLLFFPVGLVLGSILTFGIYRATKEYVDEFRIYNNGILFVGLLFVLALIYFKLYFSALYFLG